MAKKLQKQYYNVDKSKLPTFPHDSKMNDYDLIYDDTVKQNRVGFYKSRFRDYEMTNSDFLWTIQPGFEYRTDLISYKFYNTAKYDWVIEAVNNISDPIKDVVIGKQIIIPDESKVYTIR